MVLWYLSFASDIEWLGGCFVRAGSANEAIKRSWELGINPGGEVLLAPAKDPNQEIDPGFMDRLLDNAIEVGLAVKSRAHSLTTEEGQEIAEGYLVFDEIKNERP